VISRVTAKLINIMTKQIIPVQIQIVVSIYRFLGLFLGFGGSSIPNSSLGLIPHSL
jgi:hypothetical protein